MAQVSFGNFSLIDTRGTAIGDVIIAPGFVLWQRGRESAVHDLSYLAVWTAPRVEAVARELARLSATGSTIVDSTCPELRAILRAISPAGMPVFLRTGQCNRTFARRRLRAALRASDAVLTRSA